MVAVACSGGRDSMALLHATLAAARRDGVQVVALHVHHGLHAQADAWCAHVRRWCRRQASVGAPVRFASARLSGSPARGQSIEAWAREGRYAALARLATKHRAGLVLLAHHRRDQAETLLLQALRGAGPSGLAAMPSCAVRAGLVWARPWLAQPRAAIEAYVARHAIPYVDDDSNADTRHARNRLRTVVWPVLVEAFPQAEAALADSATWAQQAAEVLDEVAAQDLADVADGDALDAARWRLLSPGRQAGVLRRWLREHGQAPTAALVTRVQAQWRDGASQRWPLPGATLQHHRSRLRCVAQVVEASVHRPAREATLSIRRAGRHRLPGWGGELQVLRVREGGVPLAWLAHLDLRERQGGEQFQSGLGRPPRSLKKQFQSAGIPAWQREGPLVFSGGQLVYVPGLGLDARVLALPGQSQVQLVWRGTGGAAV